MSDTRYLTTPSGVRLAYAETGAGRPLLALHGAYGRGRPFLRLADALGPGWRIVAPDQRGHGLSDRSEDYGREAYIADAAAVIEALDLAPAVIVGHSLGGINAFQLAARRPELVAALVVVDMTAEFAPAADTWLDGLPEYHDSLAALHVALAERVTFGVPGHFLESAVEDERGWRMRPNLDDMRRVKDSVRGTYWADWTGSGHPTLLIRGTASPVVPPAVAARMVADRPNTALVSVEGAGHDFYLSHTAEFHAAVRDFLDRL